MADLVHIKGLKGKQNKKKWAKNIDVSELLEQNARDHDRELRLSFQTPLIIEDSTQCKREPLDPNRFRNKGVPLPAKKYDNSMKRKSIFNEIIEDPWTNTTGLKPFTKSLDIPAIVNPPSAHSYNPSAEDMKEIIDRVIDYEGPKTLIRRVKKERSAALVVPRARNKNRRAEQLRAQEKKLQKKEKEERANWKRVSKEEQEKDEKIEERMKTKMIKKQRIAVESKTGRVRNGAKLGKLVYHYKEYIPRPQEINLKLSHVVSSPQALKDRFDSMFRRGMVEQRNVKVHANKKKNMKTVQRKDE